MRNKGFTLIELLIVIAIIAVLAGVVFVALDPLSRFQDARDSRRWSEVTSILSAIKIHQVDNAGSYLPTIANATTGSVYMIGTATTGCTVQNANCDTDVTGDTNCVDISGLATAGYMGSVPTSPNGAGSWTAAITGYTLQKSTAGTITIRACESENTTEIAVSR